MARLVSAEDQPSYVGLETKGMLGLLVNRQYQY